MQKGICLGPKVQVTGVDDKIGVLKFVCFGVVQDQVLRIVGISN